MEEQMPDIPPPTTIRSYDSSAFFSVIPVFACRKASIVCGSFGGVNAASVVK